MDDIHASARYYFSILNKTQALCQCISFSFGFCLFFFQSQIVLQGLIVKNDLKCVSLVFFCGVVGRGKKSELTSFPCKRQVLMEIQMRWFKQTLVEQSWSRLKGSLLPLSVSSPLPKQCWSKQKTEQKCGGETDVTPNAPIQLKASTNHSFDKDS